MEELDPRILAALEQTRVVRAPQQHLATFGVTNLKYYVVTEPAYADAGLPRGGTESVLREGKVTAQRPEVVTPSYMMRLQGFGGEARRTLEMLAARYGPNSPGLFYTYRNEASGFTIVSGEPDAVAENVRRDLDRRGEGLAVVLRGPDILWDISLLKFIYDFTAFSAASNAGELMSRGLMEPDPTLGIPRAGAERVEALFRAVESGQADPSNLKQELDRWGLFEHYQDRFLGLFRRQRG